MATLTSTVLTLAEWAKRLDPDGKTAAIVELLSMTNRMLDDMQWKEGNLPTGERTVIRTGLPAVAWRLLNNGVVPSKSLTVQIDEQCGMLEAWSEIDKDLVELNGNETAFRLSEGVAFVEAMNQEMAQTLIYGNTSLAPEEFTGLAIRYSSLAAANAQNIIDAGGTGTDNTSIWLVGWGARTIHGIFPKSSKAGLSHEDEGLVTIESTAGIGGTRMRAYRDHWQWKAGIALRDWRYVVRICNIDVSNLVAGTGANLIQQMIRAIHRIPNIESVTPVFYANRTVTEYLDIQAETKTNVLLNVGGEEGQRKTTFRGIPIRTMDTILETEARVI